MGLIEYYTQQGFESKAKEHSRTNLKDPYIVHIVRSLLISAAL